MDEIGFDVQGSAPEPYRVTFVRKSQTNLAAYCTCPAGINGQYCKHRFAILDGVEAGVVSPNVDAVKTVQSWLSGTDVEKALGRVREIEKEADRIKKELSLAKHELAKAMRD
jgi:SWIM zinc finger